MAALLAATAPAGAQAPDWSVDPATYSSTMSITAAAFSDGTRLSSEDDLLAVFAGSEIRGVASASVVNGETLFFLTAYANSAGESLSFRLYDARADRIEDAAESVAFEVDAVVGDVAAPLSLHALGSSGSNRPAWSVDPALFGSTMNVVAELFVDGNPNGNAEALVGAFVAGEVRGVASPILVGGKWLFFLTVYGDTNGETLAFQAYDPVQDAVVSVNEQSVFTVDAVIGSTSTPFALNAEGSTGSNRPAWSVDPSAFESTMNVVAALFTDGVRSDRSTDLLAAFVGGELRGVASPTSTSEGLLYFATVYGAAGDGVVTFEAYDSASDEVVQLTEATMFVPDAVRGSLSQPFVVSTPPESGTGLNAPDWSVNVGGFGLTMNVIGSLVVDGTANGHAGSRVAAFVGEEVRGVAAPLAIGGRTLYFLTIYADGIGEQVSFRAYDGAADRLRGVNPSLTFATDNVEGSISDPIVWRTTAGSNRPTWTPDPPGFSQTMSVTARLLINDEASTHPDNIVAAFVGSDFRGSAGPSTIDGQLVYDLTLYADSGGETMRFEAYDAAADLVRPVLETIVFASGGSLGSTTNPFVLSTAVDAPQAAPILLSPADGAIDVPLRPTLVWNGIPRAASYELQLDTSDDFGNPLTIDEISTTSFAVVDPLSLSATYFWRVRGRNETAAGPWSEARRFSTIRPSVGSEEAGEMPDRFALEQNYPNPFNPSTQIGYVLPATEHVQIVVHDMLGRLIATLVDEVRAPGRHAVRFDAGALGSGLYVYRIQAGTFSASRTLTVIK
ncbi:MAG: T9SS type A sorting domain-containing protein [Rhodothermia bacterium]|nr:T9SS type A sorting domain-containing protein [Rhodothermia bacterium]